MQVRELAVDERAYLHGHFALWLTAEVQCSPGAFWPSLGQLTRADLVFVAEHDSEPVGSVLADETGRIDWLLTRADHTGPAFDALCAAVYAACRVCHGRVENAGLRAAYLSAAPNLTQPDGADPTIVRWGP